MKFIFFLIFITCAVTAEISPKRQCINFYSGTYTFPRTAIGDGYEPRYTPKGKTVELKEVEVTDQCSTYECYLFAVINFFHMYNRNVNADLSQPPPRLSEPYLVAHKFLQHIKEGIRRGVDHAQTIHDLEGGHAYEAMHLARVVGLVPAEAWTPKIDFPRWNVHSIYRELKTKVPAAHEELKALAKAHKSWRSKAVQDRQKELYTELSKLVLNFTGPLPTQFSFRGETLTPKEFEKRFGLPSTSQFVVHNKTEIYLPFNYEMVLNETFTKTGGKWEVLEGAKEEIVKQTQKFIELGIPVLVDFNWRDDGHTMVITGIEYGSNGELVRFKAMNSWGKVFGNNGYAWYTIPDFWKNSTSTYRVESHKRSLGL